MNHRAIALVVTRPFHVKADTIQLSYAKRPQDAYEALYRDVDPNLDMWESAPETVREPRS